MTTRPTLLERFESLPDDALRAAAAHRLLGAVTGVNVASRPAELEHDQPAQPALGE